ncbi:MAG: phosphatase PAP2 family protein [Actinomycetota bacterium]|nr:phosphatase PAP2 family protein [Actinomycetota bacterium]
MKFVFAAVWPAGLAIIFAVAAVWSRQAARKPAPAAAGGGGGSHVSAKAPSGWFSGAGLIDAAKVIALTFIGAALVYGVMDLLGLLVVNHGLAIDRPIYTWTTHHWVHPWFRVMDRLTKIGDTWTCWAAAATASVCLSVTWRTKRWLPPVVLAACIVVDHFTTQALRHTFHRVGPPDSPFGTYPSGGCDRTVLFFGLIAYLLWREFSGRRSTAVWAGAAVAALGFNEAYSRIYLTLHWFTDALSGLLYGALLLAVFIIAIRFVAGPAVIRTGPGGDRPHAADESSLTSETLS